MTSYCEKDPLVIGLVVQIKPKAHPGMMLFYLVLMMSTIITTVYSSVSTPTRPSNANMYEVANFTDPNSNRFNHLTVHNVTGDVYVGGVNQLYRLNENLKLIVNITTGPEYDYDGDGHDTNNKILTMNSFNDDLITCGGYLGDCQKRDAYDLSTILTNNNQIYVVSNKTHETSVGFVALHYHLGEPLLYVGTTSTSVNPGSPFVSGRRIEGHGIFQVFEDERSSTRVDVSPIFTTTFPIRYVAGFSYNGYSYFVTVQKSSTESSNYISKLVRVCQRAEQQYFNSYTEVTLRCRDDSYNLAQATYLTRPARDLSQSLTLDDGEEVLFVTFAEGENDLPTPTTNTDSAICMYRMSLLEIAFQDAAKGCMEGDGLAEYTASWMRRSSCAGVTFGFQPGVHECHAINFYTHANGVVDQDGYAMEHYPSTLVTSIAVTTVQQHTVGFLGTDAQKILKVHFINDIYANTYEEIEFKDSTTAVLQDMLFDRNGEHFYKSTDASVRKVKVSECSQFPRCMDCMESMDPYCGWCTLEKRCSRKTKCTNSNLESRWLQVFDEDQCVDIILIEPEDGVPVDVTNQITLKMIELPAEDSKNTYLCNYDGLFITSADKDGYNLTCDTPPLESRPILPPGEDHNTIQLYIRSSETQEDFVHTDFHFYDCTVHKFCSSCVTSYWSCNWCVYEGRCTHYRTSCPLDDSTSIVVGENNLFNDSNIFGQSFCPQLGMQNGEVLISVGVPTEIQVDTSNLYDSKHLQGYECVLMVEGESETITATRHNETSVTCDSRKYTYKSLLQEIHVRLILKWNSHRVVDDIYGYTVTLYNCSTFRRDCSECLSYLTTRRPLNCGWCGQSKTCEVKKLCDSDWWDFGTLNNCDPPTITQVWPLSGPFEGNTDVIIQGTDLGKQASDVVNITVANLPCYYIQERYIVSRGLECTTSASVSDYTGEVVVTVISNDGKRQAAYYKEQFTFRDPNVLDFTPKLGPKSGGTIVALHGEYVNAGRVIEASFSGSPCLINRTADALNGTLVFCNTTSANVTDSAELSMSFDGSVRFAPESKKFTFTEDPSVNDITPSTSMISGGRKINVTGTFFTSVSQPRLLITAGRPFASEKPCDVRSFSEMDCISPPVDISMPLRNNQSKSDNEITVGFIMDAVEEVRQLEFDFNIVDDPEYYPFAEEENIREHKGGQLVVQGKNLNLASTESEVIVTIGQEECRVVSLSGVQLNCIPPDEEPKGVNKSGSPTGNGLPIVIVEVGNLEFFIGYLKYPIISQAMPFGLIGGLVAAFVLLVVITIVIVIVCYLRNRKLDRQIAETENRLQTIVMETRAGPDVNVSFSDYRKYTANMVYDLHTGRRGLENLHSNTNRKMDLERFYSLLMNKFFCLVLIRTLQQQRRLTNDQKKAFGHLLTIALHEKTKIYLPELLKELFADAVIKAERTKKTKSMLKRGDTIMESILNAWFAITLYSYIKTCLGVSIYELFLAMTTQADKEPRQMLTVSTRDEVHTVFAKMLTLDEQHHSRFPAPIKFMFDMLDSLAEKHGISDGNVTRSWKCDSLHLSLWAKILQSPQYVLDINPTEGVKRGLECVAQAFIEICSETANSPSETDELYEEVSKFKTQLQKFFDDIKALPSVSEGALKQYLEEHSQDQSGSSDTLVALDELIKFVIGFHDEITEALQNDENCEKEGHAVALKELISTMIECQYEQIPGKYESLQPRPVVLYDGLHQLRSNPPQYQDLYPEQRSKYMMLQRHREERPEEASSQHTPSEYQSIQPEPKSQYTRLKFN